MISAYPSLEVQGGADATINLQYGEALYDKDGRRAIAISSPTASCAASTTPSSRMDARASSRRCGGAHFVISRSRSTTAAEPLTLRALRLHETGYPFEQVASFVSSDAELNRIWEIGWRTMRVDAHETFMDSSYWEQLQYTGDTRLEMLITYAVSGDARLARQAIDAFAESDVDGGLVQGAYPSRLPNVIATFSFAWVGMLADWALEQPDTRVHRETPAAHAPRARLVRAAAQRAGIARQESAVEFHRLVRSEVGRPRHISFVGKPERQLPHDGDVGGRAAAGCGTGTRTR